MKHRKRLSEKEHRTIHHQLHRCLDMLVADWMQHTGKLPSCGTILDLMEWSFEQTKNPSVKDEPEEKTRDE